jgi:Predicted AAA-ATPase/PD-(D/E)XK nuclease superfamily
MQKLPLGIQEFSELRKLDCLYVDKTELIYELIKNGKYYFVSRPRRFGKSLLVNTLKEIFLGNQHYFKGLWIENKIKWGSYPVIKIDFSLISYQDQPLSVGIKNYLERIIEEHDISITADNVKEIFAQIIKGLFQKYQKQVVILIDEYDKPIIDYLEDVPKAEQHRNELKNLYSIIKGSDQYIKFFFLTGVSKFAKVGIFSDLNNIKDLSMHPKFVTLFGYTQQELEANFEDRIARIAGQHNTSTESILEKIKHRYNGYSWDAKNYVYNPYSTLSFLDTGKFDNYWFATGTPTFLTKLLKKGFHYELKNIRAGSSSFDTSNLSNLDYVSVLFQTGYLTIKEDFGYEMYGLDFPNTEVQDAFNQFLLGEYAEQHPGRMQPAVFNLFLALKTDDFQEVKLIFNALFASIPNDYFVQSREKYYHAIVFLTFRLLGFFTQIEINSGQGRLDCVVFVDNKIFLFEFKLDQSVAKALAQIKTKNYYRQFQGQGKDIYLVGVNMISDLKEMEDFLVEKI